MSLTIGRPLCAVMLGIAGLGAAMPASNLHAEPAPPLKVLLLQAAAAPRVAIGEAEQRAAEGQARQAALRPNPALSLEVENFGGRAPYRSFDDAETTLSASQAVELGAKRAARIAAAVAEVDAAAARNEAGRLAFSRDLSVAYAEAEAAQARRAVARDLLAAAQDDRRAVRLLVENGKEAEVRGLQADASLSAARADLAQTEAKLSASLARLSALLPGGPTYDSVTAGVLDWKGGAPATTGSPPALTLARAERRAAERYVDVQLSQRTPDLTLSVGARRFADAQTTAAVVGVSVALPLFNRNQGAVASARANADAAAARVMVTEAEVAADRRVAEAEVVAADQSLIATREAEAAAGEAYRLSRLGYEAGRLPLLELLSARRAFAEGRGRTIDARSARFKAAVALAVAIGQPPFGETP